MLAGRYRLPEILIGGFPNSGTSFLCNLMVQLGKSPGSEENLKPADAHNRWGYFEHLGLRRMVWEAGGWSKFQPEQEGFLPSAPCEFAAEDGKDAAQAIQALAEEDDVEIYKENALPLVFRLFPQESKYIMIARSIEDIYRSPLKAGDVGYSCSVKELEERYHHYWGLVSVMEREVDCLTVNYEDFKSDLRGTIDTLVRFLDLDVAEARIEQCERLFRPRRFHEQIPRRIISYLRRVTSSQ